MTTTALQQLLAELDAAPAGCLDDVRRWVRTLAMEMMQMQAPASGRLYDATVKLAAERDATRVECTALLEERSRMRDQLSDAIEQRDAARAEVERLTKELGETITQRDELREAIDRESTAVERLTRERDRAQDGLLAVSQERNRIERETVEAIAAWVEAYPNTAYRNDERVLIIGIAQLIRSDAWRTE